MQSSLRISRPLVFLCVFLISAQFMSGAHAVRSGYSNSFNFWYALAFFWALGWWFIHDSREHGLQWAEAYLDMGMWLYIAWIFLLPYYFFKTRGWKAVFTIGLLLGVSFGAYLLGVIFSVALGLL